MKIVCLVFSQIGSEEGKTASIMMSRQIRAPEEVHVVEGDSDPVSTLLAEAFRMWHTLTDSQQRDTAFLLQGQCEIRKDAVDYLRKTYVPSRIVTYLQQNPFLINGVHAMPLDPSGLVLLPPRFFRMASTKADELVTFIKSTPGSKSTAFGYFVAKHFGIPAGALGSVVPYCRPLKQWDMTLVEETGDYLSTTD